MFNELVKTGFEVKRRNGKIYTWLPPTLRKYGEFVRWVQWKPYRDALENNLDSASVEAIKVKCQKGKVTEKAVPDDWLLNEETGKYEKEPKEKDLVEKEFDIHLGSACVVKHFISAEGLAKLLQLGISISHPKVTEIIIDQEIDIIEQKRAIEELQNVMFAQEEEIEKNEPSPDQSQ